MKAHKSVTFERVSAAVERGFSSLDNPGFCLACGDEADGCEPDARGYRCEACGVRKVYGAERNPDDGSSRMTEVVVWRFETADGRGPYRGCGYDRDWRGEEFQPAPTNDPYLYEWWSKNTGRHGKRFGFESFAAAMRWFTEYDRADMPKYGIRLCRWRVPKEDVWCGLRQVVFFKNRASLIDDFDPTINIEPEAA